MFNLGEIKNNSVIFSRHNDKKRILRYLSEKSLFLSLDFYDFAHGFIQYKSSYPFFMKKRFGVNATLSDKMKSYFDYIDINKTYRYKKIEYLKQIKLELLKNDLITEKRPDLTGKTIFSVNKEIIPSFFSRFEKKELFTNELSLKPYILYYVEDQTEQALCVFEKVVELLKNKVDINDIVILNSTSVDDYYLDKFFSDANIFLTINKNKNVKELPYVINLTKILKDEGFWAFKELLEKTIIRDDILPEVLFKLTSVYNKYNEKDMAEDPSIILYDIERLTYSEGEYKDTINVNSFEDFNYYPNKHYLILNFTDTMFPKLRIDNDYLSDNEKENLDMPVSRDLNVAELKRLKTILNGIDNIVLFFPKNLESEMRISEVNIDRTCEKIDYSFVIKPKVYFNTYDKLVYAKKKYDLNNYYQKSSDYDLLNNTYSNLDTNYIPQFTGINETTLKRLLSKHNSLTGQKIEIYNLCPFQYLLRFLLKIDEFKPNLAKHIGTMSHKVLEESILGTRRSVHDIIHDITGFPEDILYKEEIFLQALEKDLEELVKTVLEFHKQTRFTKTMTEKSFEIKTKLDTNFELKGVIDKTLIQEKNDKYYFVIIDYKLGNKDFDMNKFEQGRQLQLPFYMYCLIKDNPNKKMEPVGFYYQTTSLGRVNITDKDISNKFKLKGISINDLSKLRDLDQGFTFLKGINLKKDGTFTKNSTKRLLDKNGFKELINKTQKMIIKAMNGIKAGDFKIAPLPTMGVKKDSVSCEYCDYFSICYLKNSSLEVKDDE